MPDFNNPLSTQPYLALLASIVENNQSNLKMLDGVALLTNLPINAKRWNPSNSRFENWNGSTWEELTALLEMKVRNSDQLNGQIDSFYRNAGNLNAGVLAAARFNDTSHGSRVGGSTHSLATGSAAGFMSSSLFNKLSNIESNATANQSAGEILTALLSVDGPGSGINSDYVDNYHASDLLARNNHSGTQPSSTITGLGALAVLNQVPSGSIGQAEMGANSVGQSEVKTTYQEVSASIPFDGTGVTYFTFSGGVYALGHTSRADRTNVNGTISISRTRSSVNTSNIASWALMGSDNAVSAFIAYGRLYYINSSPPYDLGFGEVPLFIFVLRNKVTKDIKSVSLSPDAPWHYNGPTDITPSAYDKDGTVYKDFSQYELDLIGQGKVLKNEMRGVNREAVLDSFRTSPIVRMELTQAMKNADMPDIPQPFGQVDILDEVIVLNPQSNACIDLLTMHELGLNVVEVITDGGVNIGNIALPRGFDPSVKCFDISWA